MRSSRLSNVARTLVSVKQIVSNTTLHVSGAGGGVPVIFAVAAVADGEDKLVAEFVRVGVLVREELEDDDVLVRTASE